MDDLKKQKIWVCWKGEIQEGRPSKILYSYKGFKTGTSEKYADHWGYYEDAISSKKENDFDGVGLVLPPGIGGIDLDDIEADNPLVNEIRQIMKTYEELSPSGNGIHFLFKADTTNLPVEDNKLSRDYYSKNPHNGMEIYIGGLTNRYLTFTGEVITELPVMERTEEVKLFLDNYMRREIFQLDNESDNALNDFDIIATARRAKNGDKFISLFDEGDTSNYGSHSEADKALCNILAFYTA
jgi:primase-polymerase (primpol)-like protein